MNQMETTTLRIQICICRQLYIELKKHKIKNPIFEWHLGDLSKILVSSTF